LLIILLMTTIPFFYSLVFKEKTINVPGIENELAILRMKQTDSIKKYYRKNFDEENDHQYYQYSEKKYQQGNVKAELFYFDPNTINSDEWKRLGLRDKTINTILNFISKGGKFRQPDDIKKIWGLHEDEIQRLMPYVRIASINPPAENSKQLPVFTKYDQKKSVEIVDINLADTTALIRLPGIGPKLSNRIINFRDKLGGFYTIEQVSETFGLADSVFQKIKPLFQLHDRNIRQLNINTASLDELKQHPYIRYNLASLIVQYRTQHGNFVAVSDIKKIMTVTDELYNKLSPYLAIQ
jgi:competence protein ComEA